MNENEFGAFLGGMVIGALLIILAIVIGG